MTVGAGSGSDSGDPLDALFSCLADECRRRLLGILHERGSMPLTPFELATQLTSETAESSQKRDPNEAVQRALAALRHVHLPTVVAAGLATHDSERGLVTIADHPAYEDAGVVDAIRSRTDDEAESLDALFTALSDPRRRTVLASLNHSFHRIHLETLARDVGARERGTAESSLSGSEVERIICSLRHAHLPHLSDADLIAYDPEDRTVAYEGHPLLRISWLHSLLEPDFRSALTRAAEANGVRTIEGREDVVAYSQWLLERVDEELFSIFTATGLLESGCFARVMDASRRGVDVYLGTTDPVVRENAPEIALWEPEEEWLDVLLEEDRVARLLLADREALMLGTLGERRCEHVHEETAFVGDGDVTRHLLGSRIDEIDRKTRELEPSS